MSTLVKGSPEALAWAKKMKKARIRAAGRRTEAQFFGPGGEFEDEAAAKRRKNPEREIRELYLWATNDGALYRQYEVSAIEHAQREFRVGRRPPHAAWMSRFNRWAKESARRYVKEFAGTGDPVDLIFSKSDIEQVALDRANYWKREFELGNFLNKPNPNARYACKSWEQPSWRMIVSYIKQEGWKPLGKKGVAAFGRTVRRLSQILQLEATAWRVLYSTASMSAPHSLGTYKNLDQALIAANKQANDWIYNRKAVLYPKSNPPKRVRANVSGVMYNKVKEIQAEKTGNHKHKGFWYHPFKGKSAVEMLALDNGDLLIHSKAEKKLWREA